MDELAEVPGMAETLDHIQEVLLQERNDLRLVLGQWRRNAYGLFLSCYLADEIRYLGQGFGVLPALFSDLLHGVLALVSSRRPMLLVGIYKSDALG